MSNKGVRVVTVSALNQVHTAQEKGMTAEAETVLSGLIYGGIREGVTYLPSKARPAWEAIKELERDE